MKNWPIPLVVLTNVLSVFLNLCPVRGEDLMTRPLSPSEHSALEVSGYGISVQDGQGPHETQLIGSGNDNTGLVNVNQASGHMNNQANVRVFSSPSDFSSSAEIRIRRSVHTPADGIRAIGGKRRNVVENALQDNVGVIGINQSSGSLNAQSNTLVMAIGGQISLTEAQLGDVSPPNLLQEEKIGERLDMIRHSLSNTRGIVQLTQSSGDMNILGNNCAFSFREVTLR